MNTLDYLNKYYKDLEKEQHIKYMPLLNRIWCTKDKQSYKELVEYLSVSIRYHYDLNSFHRLEPYIYYPINRNISQRDYRDIVIFDKYSHQMNSFHILQHARKQVAMNAVRRALKSNPYLKTDDLEIGKIYKGAIWSSSSTNLVIELYDTHIFRHTIEQMTNICKESSIRVGNQYFIKIKNASIYDIETSHPLFVGKGFICRALKIAFDISDLTLEY